MEGGRKKKEMREERMEDEEKESNLQEKEIYLLKKPNASYLTHRIVH